jgi:hypothetical protein
MPAGLTTWQHSHGFGTARERQAGRRKRWVVGQVDVFTAI